MESKKSMIENCADFTRIRNEKLGKDVKNNSVDVKFISNMIMDELDELKNSKDLAEQVDALFDIVYYSLQHLSTIKNIPPKNLERIWEKIHEANMRKFEKGYMADNGKWMKPDDFQPPDDEIREIIKETRNLNI